MKKAFQIFTYVFLFITGGVILSSFYTLQINVPAYRFPYQKMGLTESVAAAHLLSRFSFGVKTNEIETVVKTGLETWFQQQLEASQNDAKVWRCGTAVKRAGGNGLC